MSEEISNKQSNLDRLADFTDRQLIDFYHRNGLIEADDMRSYSREDVLKLVRGAYWQGARDIRADNDGAMRRAAADYRAREQGTAGAASGDKL
jgi:hypothetical protein